eukprot:3505268-Amphidinium_carterae.2
MIYTRIWTPVDDDEYLAVVYHSVTMVNQHANRSGYSAVQRVLGYMPQLPNELLHETDHPALICEGPVEAVRRSERIRAVALEAWAKVASRQRVLASLRSRSRGAPRPFVVGERVWVLRRQEGEDKLSDEMIGRFLSRLRTDMAQEGFANTAPIRGLHP